MKIKSDPINKTALKALQLQEQGSIEEAVKLFRKVLSTSPADWISLFSMGRILLYEGKPHEAIKLIDRLLIVKKHFAPAIFLRGATLEQLERLGEAINEIDRGLLLEPHNVDELHRRGVLSSRLGRLSDAIASYERALAVNPNHQSSLFYLGELHWMLKHFPEARGLFERLIAINPDFSYAKGFCAYIKLHEANWDGIAEQITEITGDIRAGKRACMSLAFMAMSESSADQLQCARLFANEAFRKSANPVWNGERYKHDRIRVAYVSADFREHPVGHLLSGVIDGHDKSRFETIAISLGVDDQSVLRRRFMTSFDQFVDARSMHSDAIAQWMRAAEVDIAVDLSGFTYGARTDLFARRVAPVQVNFLGYPGTMGTDYMDYILADHHVIPAADHANYAERVAYLPDTYLPTDSDLAVADHTPTRSEMGLPESGFVFCSFNHIFKINPKMFAVWMQLLAAVDGSVLWLSKHEAVAMDNLLQEASRHGIDARRLVFAERIPLVQEHLARYRLADLFLDTSPYNAHTTAADALFAGLPVVTVSGRTFAGRVAGSLLQAIGLAELVTDSLAEYGQLALALARDQERLMALRSRLDANKGSFPLFATARYCRHLEAAFATMLDRHQRGEAPASFVVEPIAR